ncbi:MAG: hypothetical protein QOE63_2118, partial [Acidimicrobiaceae bacterium]
MSQPEVRTATFPPELISARRARHLVEDQIAGWGLETMREAAALCTAELAANAILHTRRPFTLAVRRTGNGARIDVVDAAPDQLPIIVPTTGSADDIVRAGLTGRGLQIIAALANRWGAFTAGSAKTVWAELDAAGAPSTPAAGVFEDNRTPVESPTARTVLYLDLPVRPAVASGVQLDEAVRHLQLGGDRAGEALDPRRVGELFELLDRSAPVRLTGRHAAFLASGEQRERFDLSITADVGAFEAVVELRPLLSQMSQGSSVVWLSSGVA